MENWKLELKNAQQQKVNGRNRVKADIYFTAVGIVNIPTETEMKAAMEELQRSRKAGNHHIKQQRHSPQM